MPQLIPQQLGKILFKLTYGQKGKHLETAVEEFMSFVRKKHLTKKMPYILNAFDRVAKEHEGTLPLHITSAHPLNSATQKAIEKQFGGVSTEEVLVDPALIGGVIVRHKNTIFDASIASQLDSIKKAL